VGKIVVRPPQGKFWDARTKRYTHVPPVRRRRPPPDYDNRDTWIPFDAFVAIEHELAGRYQEASSVGGRRDAAMDHLEHHFDNRKRVARVLEVGHWYAARPGQVPPRELRYDLEVIVSWWRDDYDDGETILKALVMLEQWPAISMEAREAMRDRAVDTAAMWSAR
jgi:hypothetical protein